MIIYSGTSVDFQRDVNQNQIANKIEANFISKIGYSESPNEKRAWRNSMNFMNNAIRNANIPDDCGVLIEYMIPNTSNRVDFILTGEDENHHQNYVLVELKQWEKAEVTDIPQLVRTFVGGGYHNVDHPSRQAESYDLMMKSMNEGIYGNNIGGYPCAYLHNYEQKHPEPLLDDRYKDLVRQAPVYFQDDYGKLEETFRKYVGHGKGMAILYEIANGKIRPSKKLVECIDSLYQGNDDFILIDEQNVAYQTILKKSEDLDHKSTIIVKGGPGTGKSVISFKLLKAMIDRRLNAKFIAPNEAFRETMKTKLIKDKVEKKKVTDQLFSGSSTLYGAPSNYFDVIITDEAHRLKGKGAYMYRGQNQIKDIIHASVCSIFFVDDTQQVRPDDIGSVEEIRRIAAEEDSSTTEIELKAQFRCAGAEGFINWITDVLQMDQTGNYDGWDSEAFDFLLVDDPNTLFSLIKEKNSGNTTARLTAGYAWPWTKSDKHANINDVRIPEYNFAMPWNEDYKRALYATKSDSINQVGCIHTVQGLEFDYIGVIIGNDLKYNPETRKVYADYAEYYDAGGKKGLKNDEGRLTQYIKNIYKVLMSRGMKGCYVFCRDKNLQAYFEQRLKLIHYEKGIYRLHHQKDHD